MTSNHNHSYYHEDELVSPSRHVTHSRTYEQAQHQHPQNQFQTRLSQSVDTSGTAGDAVEGAMFYSPSSFAQTRMAAQQYSAAPTSADATYHSQAEYLDSELAPSGAGTTSANTYYGTTQDQSHLHSQYTVTPIPALQPNLHVQVHQDVPPGLLSTEVPTHPAHVSPTGSVSGPGTSNAIAPRISRPMDPPSPTNLNARRHTTADIGKWKSFSTGPFAGRTIRAEIKEVQKADLGRKCADPPTSSGAHGGSGPGVVGNAGKDGEGSDVPGARRGKEKEHYAERDAHGKEKEGETKAVRKDRRPLDPPPVVELKFFESIHHATQHEYERPIPAEEVEIGGLICQVDLFRVTIPPSPTEVASLTLHAHAGGVGPVHGVQPFGYSHHPVTTGLATHPPHTYGHATPSSYDQHGFSYPHPPPRRQSVLGPDEENGASNSSPLDAGWESASPISPVSPYTHHRNPPHAHQVPTLNTHVPTLHNLSSPSLSAPIDPDALPPPSESDKLSRVLFGESYSHACSILDLHGRPVLYFVFSDLSVKLEGLFRPRYRFFDLFSRTSESPDVPILAQCFGGAFAVYSTKEFPGLKASTPLTKHLSRWGIRVNIRETERKRRAPDSGGGSKSNGVLGTGKDKKRGGHGGGGRKARGGSVAGSTGAGASSGASVRGEDDVDETGSVSSPVGIPRGVDAPKRYLEGTSRGRAGRAKAGNAAGTSGMGETRGRGRSRGD